MSDWQLIDTAPKDKDILLAGQWLSGTWDFHVGRYLVSRWPFVGQGQPTHWKELIPPT